MEIALEHVLPDERGALRHPGREGAVAAVLHERGVELHANRPCSTLCGRDHDPAVARAQVVHDVVGFHVGEPEHVGDHARGRGNEW